MHTIQLGTKTLEFYGLPDSLFLKFKEYTILNRLKNNPVHSGAGKKVLHSLFSPLYLHSYLQEAYCQLVEEGELSPSMAQILYQQILDNLMPEAPIEMTDPTAMKALCNLYIQAGNDSIWARNRPRSEFLLKRAKHLVAKLTQGASGAPPSVSKPECPPITASSTGPMSEPISEPLSEPSSPAPTDPPIPHNSAPDKPITEVPSPQPTPVFGGSSLREYIYACTNPLNAGAPQVMAKTHAFCRMPEENEEEDTKEDDDPLSGPSLLKRKKYF